MSAQLAAPEPLSLLAGWTGGPGAGGEVSNAVNIADEGMVAKPAAAVSQTNVRRRRARKAKPYAPAPVESQNQFAQGLRAAYRQFGGKGTHMAWCPIEAGLIGQLADNECTHGRLQGDRTPPCGCWAE